METKIYVKRYTEQDLEWLQKQLGAGVLVRKLSQSQSGSKRIRTRSRDPEPQGANFFLSQKLVFMSIKKFVILCRFQKCELTSKTKCT